MSRFAVRRRLAKGVDELRDRLKTSGVVVSAAVLAALLSANAAQAAPATVVASLGKLSLAGILPEGPTTIAEQEVVTGPFGTSTAKTVFTVLLTIVVGAVLYHMIRGASGGKGKVLPTEVPLQPMQQQMEMQPQATQSGQRTGIGNVNVPGAQGASQQQRTPQPGPQTLTPGAGGGSPAGGRASETAANGQLRTVIEKVGDAQPAPPKKGK